MTTREAALALVAELRAAGVRFVVELETLRLTYRDPAGAVTPEVLARWDALAVDVRAVVFGELADVANLAALAGLPADLTACVQPAGRRRGTLRRSCRRGRTLAPIGWHRRRSGCGRTRKPPRLPTRRRCLTGAAGAVRPACAGRVGTAAANGQPGRL